MPTPHTANPPRSSALVVDDQLSTLLLMRAMFDRAGYNVVECASGQVALEALRKETYDLMVLDLNLPDMSGIDLLHHARLEKLPPVLGMTAVLTPEIIEKAESVGISRVLEKPFSYEQLIETAATAINAAKSVGVTVRSGSAIDSIVLSEVRQISDELIFHRFVEQALADAWRCIHTLDHASDDLEHWRGYAQTLNGVARTIGARHLVRAISDALLLSPRQLGKVMPMLTRQFADLLDETQEALRRWLADASGDQSVNSAICRNVPESLELTEREREVLRWTAAGKTSSETGAILGITARTVNYHVTSILLKLNAVNRTQAVVKAMVLDLLN